MSPGGGATGEPLRLGVIVPVHSDAPSAMALASQLAHQSGLTLSLDIVFIDNGGNGDLAQQLSAQGGLICINEAARGPGHARTAGFLWLVNTWRGERLALDRCWVISLDADASVDARFVSDWEATIRGSDASLIAGRADLQPLRGEAAPPADALLAAQWLWDFTLRCEALVGPVNVSGCNHAVRADLCETLGAYIQPTQRDEAGHTVIVAGDDWDFGLRARLQGYAIARAGRPACQTSSRRLTANPTGFLTGQSYEGAFRPVAVESVTPWPPRGTWREMAEPALARLAAHFLIKPVLCGIPLMSAADWFLSPEIKRELAQYARQFARPEGEWVPFRRQLIERLFQPDLMDVSARLAVQLQGITRP